MPQKLDLLGIAEIAEMIGVSRQRVDQLSRSDTTFPKPVAEIHAGRIWLRSDVVQWASENGRLTKLR